MTTGRTTNLDLALPVEGELDGQWGDEVNNGITKYIDIAVAGTLTLTGDGAVTLALTEGDNTADNIGSTTAQYAILKIVGPLTATKVITAPSSSKTYTVINTDSTYGVTVKASGQTGVTVAAGTRASVVFNGTDYVSVSSSTGTGDVVGPASATDNAVVRFDGTTGKLVQNSAVTVADTTGNITGGTYNKVTITAPATGSTLTIADGKTLTANNSLTLAGVDGKTATINNSLTFAGTDSTTMTFPSSSATLAGLGIAQTFTATQTFSGSSSALSVVLNDAAEVVTVSATAATGTINYDITTQSVLYYTSNAAANWTVNFRASSGTSLDTALATGQCVTVAFLVTQGATAYYNSAVQVDGSSVTPKWQGGTAPTAGNASSIDAYVYTIVKTGAATFTVFASQTKFA